MAKKAVILKAVSKKKYLPNSKEKIYVRKTQKILYRRFVAMEKKIY